MTSFWSASLFKDCDSNSNGHFENPDDYPLRIDSDLLINYSICMLIGGVIMVSVVFCMIVSYIQHKKKEIQSIRQHNAQLLEQVDLLEMQANTLISQTERDHEEHAQARDELVLVERELDTLSGALQQQRAQFEAQILALQQEVQLKEDAFNQGEEERALLRREMSGLDGKVAALQQAATENRVRWERVQQGKQARLHAMEQQRDSCKQEAEQAAGQLEQQSVKLAAAECQVNQLEARETAGQQMLKARGEQLKSMRAEIEQAEQVLFSNQDAAQRQIKSLRDQLVQKDNQICGLEVALEEKDTEMKDLSEELRVKCNAAPGRNGDIM